MLHAPSSFPIPSLSPLFSQVEAKIAVPRGNDSGGRGAPVGGGSGAPGGSGFNVSKIFVGGLSPSVDDADFRAYFEPWGTIVEAQIMLDHQTQRSRGFGFVTFDGPGPVDQLMQRQDHSIKGKEVELKRAFPRGDPRADTRGGGGGRGGPMMMRGGGDRVGGGGYDNFGRNAGGPGGAAAAAQMMPQMMQMYQMMMMATQMASSGTCFHAVSRLRVLLFNLLVLGGSLSPMAVAAWLE